MQGKLAPHEKIELHELLSFKTVGCTKASTMKGLVSDNDLKDLMSDEVKIGKKHLTELQGLLQTTIS